MSKDIKVIITESDDGEQYCIFVQLVEKRVVVKCESDLNKALAAMEVIHEQGIEISEQGIDIGGQGYDISYEQNTKITWSSKFEENRNKIKDFLHKYR